MSELSFIAIIPARYASSRFPGKPLARLGGKSVIERVWLQVTQAVPNALVATDDERIASHVRSFGGKAVLTGSHHRSGTDRCREAYELNGGREDVIINVQGDEPFIKPEQILALQQCFADPQAQIATLVKPFPRDGAFSDLANPNSPKVVFDDGSNALLFSRSVIPYLRDIPQEQWPARHQYYTHLGMYAYRAEVLAQVTALPPSPLETAESLEQLRWLQSGMKIKVAVTGHTSIGIDTPADLERAERYLLSQLSAES